jgi:hypothetical protein
MQKAPRALSGCIKNQDLPGLDLDCARPGPFTVHRHDCSQSWSRGRSISRILAKTAKYFLLRRNLIYSDPDLPALGLHRPSGLYRQRWFLRLHRVDGIGNDQLQDLRACEVPKVGARC